VRDCAVEHLLLRAPAALGEAEEKEWAAKTGVVWPDQASYGTHINISGAGVLKYAPHRENAIKFLEYLASDPAQATSPTATTSGRR
jgi:ABC-type Fe3+ transport system substrate-binding protein